MSDPDKRPQVDPEKHRQVDADARPKVDLRRLVGLARPHWKALTFATLALLSGSGLALLYPQAARITIDEVLSGKAGLELRTVGLVVLGIFLLQAVFVSLRQYLFTVVGDRVVTDLRKRLYDAVLTQEVGFFDATRTGELTSRLTSDTQVLQNTVTVNVSMALRFGMQALGGVAVLFLTSARLAVVMVIAVPSVVALAVVFGRKVRRLSRQVQDRLAHSTSIAEEALAGIRTVRGFARERAEGRRYGEAVEHSFQAARTRAIVGALFGGAASFLGYATIALVLWLGGQLVLDDLMSPGELTAFILYTLMVAFALGALSGLWTDFMRAAGSAERVFQLIDRVPEVSRPERPISLRLAGAVEFEDVTFAYPTRPEVKALDGVRFEVSPGEKLAVVGASGAGKSTLANLLMRFYDPQQGRILLDGVDVTGLDPDALREQIGIVAQEPVLFSGTLAENVRYGRPEATDAEVEDALRAANAWDFVQGFPDGVETVIGERGVRLSGGQKQRVAIARALLKDPAVLLLDEATSALDVETEALVQQALEVLMEGRTTLIIAHRLSTVAGADRVLVLDRGRVIEAGAHGELMGQGGVYDRLVESQRLLQ